MSEGLPNGRQENTELSRLIQELELQIDGVNEGLSKIRGTVARISYAALGSAAPTSYTPWDAAPAQQSDWSPSPAPEARPDQAESRPETGSSEWEGEGPPAEKVRPPSASQPSPTFAPDVTPPDAGPKEEHEWSDWGAGAEGRSWPQSQFDTPTGESREADAWSRQTPVSGEPGVRPVSDPETNETPAAQPEADAWSASQTPDGQDDTTHQDRPASTPGGLSSGWPDESLWSPSFQWPAMKQEQTSQPEPVRDEEHIDVSDIVAQVKAELEAARRGEIPMPSWDDPVDELTSADSEDAGPALSAEPETLQAEQDPGQDDEARREEVSRAVAEMRAQLEAGGFDEAWYGAAGGDSQGFGGRDASATQDLGEQDGEPQPDEDVRAEVRRAVEATRQELSDTGEKPAFRLAAPGSLPDWSHMQMEPSGPPVVVLKDADGRVELASVYETLNELGCGDGAALLNYTPHSVTVGLPVACSFPSKERMADAVEKVFGLPSKVDSDGVRITVSIGEGSKGRSEGAA